MVDQCPEEPSSSLTSNEQAIVSKEAITEKPTCSSLFVGTRSLPGPAHHIRQSYDTCLSWMLSRLDKLYLCLKEIIIHMAASLSKLFLPEHHFSYVESILTSDTELQLKSIPRKTLVLDLDETLVHSCYFDPEANDIIGCTFVPESAVPDYVMKISILEDEQPIEFKVFKRPFVDEFLHFVGRWYDVVIYTASLEAYACQVIDKLDAGHGILQKRFYRQHCVATDTIISKDLNVVSQDLRNVFIIDNSPNAYRDFPHNAIPIKSYIYDLNDMELLKLLPFLDALRFTNDVRSILRRRNILDVMSS